MKIPQSAIIPATKLTDYLLAYRRKSDKSQFLAQAGFTLDDPAALAGAIRGLIAEHDGTVDRRNEYGVFYRVEGILRGPQGDLEVITVWLRREVDGKYWFITLKPAR
jgi:hypothetical protein